MDAVGNAEAITPAMSPLARELARLEARDKAEPRSPDRPSHLPVAAIKRLPEVFQPRQESEAHLSDLRRALKASGELEPMLVLRIGEDVFLIDGHHRLTVYRAERVTAPVPVTFFDGTVRAAVIAAGKANHRAKLTMTTAERSDRAWAMVVAGGFSISQTVDGSGTVAATVSTMRKAAKALGEDAVSYDTWWKARQAAQGKAGGFMEFSDDDRERWLAEQAASYTRRLGDEFGTKLSNNPPLAAMALAGYFGRRLPDLVRHLRDHVSEDDWSGAEDEAEENSDF